MTDRERARELWSALGLEKESHTLVIMQALAAVRAETAEQAAKVCDERSEWANRHIASNADDPCATFGTYGNACDDCAENIRSLKTGDTND